MKLCRRRHSWTPRAACRFAGSSAALEADSDTLVFLGDLIDRGLTRPASSPIHGMSCENPERVIVLRGNHEQMMLDFIDEDSRLWLSPVTGGDQTFQQYTLTHLRVETDEDFENARRRIEESVPREHLEFFRRMPLYHEDDYALYVHAGMDKASTRATDRINMWKRTLVLKKYRGKPCVFVIRRPRAPSWVASASRHLLSHRAIALHGLQLHAPLTCLRSRTSHSTRLSPTAISPHTTHIIHPGRTARHAEGCGQRMNLVWR